MASQRLRHGSFLASSLVAGCDSTSPTSNIDQPAEVVKLTQIGCQFLETESGDFKFKTTKADDCKKVNNKTLKKRKSGFKPLLSSLRK